MKEDYTEDQKILDANIHNIDAWTNLHLGLQHTYTKKNEDNGVNSSGVSGTVVRCHRRMTPQK